MPLNSAPAPIAGAALLAAVTDAIVALYLHHHDRAPMTARTQLLGADMLACTVGGIVSSDAAGEPDGAQDIGAVREAHMRFHQTVRARCIESVERLTGRKVEAYSSQLHVGPGVAVEFFTLAPDD